MEIKKIVADINAATSPAELTIALAPLSLTDKQISQLLFLPKDLLIKEAFALYIKNL